VRFDPISAVEACYAPPPGVRAWLVGLLEALRPLDRGLGVYVEEYDPTMPSGFVVEQRVSAGIVNEGVFEALDRQRSALPPDLMRHLYSACPPVDYTLRRAGTIGPEVARLAAAFLRGWGARDALGMFATDAGGRALILAAPIPIGKRGPPPRILRQVECVSAHLVSAYRLRCAMAGSMPGPDDAEAILDPAGRTLHAVGESKRPENRDRLALAVRHMDRARGSTRRADPEEALRLWKGLIDGTWSLVDHTEADGRRLILARRNQPGVRDPKALAPRERQALAFAAMGHQNKYIGYLLGLPPSTVAAHLDSARRKLGLGSRRELIETFAPLVASSPPRGSTPL